MRIAGIDRVLFTTDYPYGSMKAARPFFDHMPINANDREKIAHLNAERLLGLGQDAAHLRRFFGRPVSRRCRRGHAASRYR